MCEKGVIAVLVDDILAVNQGYVAARTRAALNFRQPGRSKTGLHAPWVGAHHPFNQHRPATARQAPRAPAPLSSEPQRELAPRVERAEDERQVDHARQRRPRAPLGRIPRGVAQRIDDAACGAAGQGVGCLWAGGYLLGARACPRATAPLMPKCFPSCTTPRAQKTHEWSLPGAWRVTRAFRASPQPAGAQGQERRPAGPTDIPRRSERGGVDGVLQPQQDDQRQHLRPSGSTERTASLATLHTFQQVACMHACRQQEAGPARVAGRRGGAGGRVGCAAFGRFLLPVRPHRGRVLERVEVRALRAVEAQRVLPLALRIHCRVGHLAAQQGQRAERSGRLALASCGSRGCCPSAAGSLRCLTEPFASASQLPASQRRAGRLAALRAGPLTTGGGPGRRGPPSTAGPVPWTPRRP